jgi:hypothetical protein
MGLFMSKEKRDAINSILVSTLPSFEKPYETLGIVCSDFCSDREDISAFMYDLKKAAYNHGADAVIGITFQTMGTTKSYEVGSAERQHYYSEIESRAVGTAIKYVQNN